MKILVVVNPKSGRPNSQNIEDLVKAEAENSSFHFETLPMPSKNAERTISDRIRYFDPDMVAVAGGDGTVNLLAKILANTKIPLLIIPNGSANGMAKELSIGSIPEAIALISNGVKKPIDMVSINGHISIHLADVGLNARIVKRFEQDKKRGVLTYAKHLFGEIFLIKGYRFNIEYDNKSVKCKAVSLTFANSSKYGTGAVINPTGLLDDGKFELVIVKPFPRIKLLGIAWKMFSGKLQTSEYVQVLSCKKAKVTSSRKTTLQIDGEVIGRLKEFDIQILPKAITVIVPQEQDQT